MKVLVTGAHGQLGQEVLHELEKRRHTCIGVDVKEMDIVNYEKVEYIIKESDVEAVIHCAAYTAIDEAEKQENLCNKVNIEGTKNVAQVCGMQDIKMLYISTDCVFNGLGNQAWSPGDVIEPLNVFGQSKYNGELEVIQYVKSFYIVRTSWLYGVNGENYVTSMLDQGSKNGKIYVSEKQVGTPTYTYDLARLLVDLIETEKYGVYHASNEGSCSKFEFACELFKICGMDVKVIPVSEESYDLRGIYPINSKLDHKKIEENGFRSLPNWKNALERYVKRIGSIR